MNVDIPDYALCFPKHEYMILYKMNLVFKLHGLQRKYSCYHFGLLPQLGSIFTICSYCSGVESSSADAEVPNCMNFVNYFVKVFLYTHLTTHGTSKPLFAYLIME